MENPASSRRGKCKPRCSDKVQGKKKRTHTYRAGADGCGAGAGRVATTGPQRATTGLQCTTTGPQCPTTGPQPATMDGSVRQWVDSLR